MEKSKLKVTIFGNQYALKADASNKYIEETAAYVDKTMREIASKFQDQSDTRIAVLAALNIADELFQARQQIPSNLEVKTKKLIDTLNTALQD